MEKKKQAKQDRQLTYKESLFVDEYIACAGNATVAYCRAYQCENTPANRTEASRKVNDPAIKTEVQRRSKPYLLSLKDEEAAIRKCLFAMIDGTDTSASNSDKIRAADVLNRMSARYLNRTTDETNKNNAISELSSDELMSIINENADK